MRFVNRERESEYLRKHFASEPNSLLFLYGPKSSGKSTLLRKIVQALDTKKYAINFLDLRMVIIYNFNTFLDVFFQKDIKDKAKDIFEGITFNAGFFSLAFNEEAMVKKNAFKVMDDKLVSARKRGLLPIIIIDEIQLLKNIYVNGERYLLDELFNLFIGLTKVRHTAHIILSTSDSYFIDQIYNSTKLKKTSEFYLIDHFGREDVFKWLELENFTNEETKTVWHYLGGCPWEIQEVILHKARGERVADVCQNFVVEEYGKIFEFNRLLSKDYRQEFNRIIEVICDKGYYLVSGDEEAPFSQLLRKCIEMDIWFYSVNSRRIEANSKSIYWAFKKMIDKKKVIK